MSSTTHALTVLRTAVIALAALCLEADVSADDVDEDGLDDALEQQLINQYRPHMYYDSSEDMWPCSLAWLVQNSKLVWWKIFETPVIIHTQAELASNPGLILQACHQGQSASALLKPNDVENQGFRVDLPSPLWFGQGPPCGSQGQACNPGMCTPSPVGMYAHVIPCNDQVQYANDGNVLQVDSNDLLIQYWQYFPFNDSQAPGDYGDHSCDWTYLDVYVTRSPPHTLRYLVYHHHGDSHCSPTVCPNEYPLPGTGIPECFVEESSHEWWPFASGGGECHFGPVDYPNEDHDGLGCNHRAENVLNVGERFAPMPGLEPQMFLWFNGRFGEWWSENIGLDAFPAKSPPYQFFPSAYGVQPGSDGANWQVPIVYAYFDAAALPWTEEVGLGSRFHPFPSLATAVSKLDVNGVLRVRRNTPITQQVTIDKAMTLEAFDPPTLPSCP